MSALQTYVIGAPFDRALKLVRSAFAEVELNVVEEFDINGDLNNGTGLPCKTLLVDCPLLIFEALALDRAAAVFFPLHVVVSGIGDRTDVSIADPVRVLHARLPVGAKEPMARLVARAELALESVSQRSGAANDSNDGWRRY